MRPFVIRPAYRIKGRIFLPGDKSIAHRAVILSAIAKGKTTISNFPGNVDCLTTVRVFKQLGVKIVYKKTIASVTVSGKGLFGLRKPKKYIFIPESGTTFRLMLGLLAGQNFKVALKAGRPLSKRPMRRVTEPLRKMGAKICGLTAKTGNGQREEYPPITIKGGNLNPITYRMPVASAQVKSAILLAGLYASGITKIIEPMPTRDHTERMLKAFKADIKVKANVISIRGNKNLVSPGKLYVPADISSAAFFMVAAAILPNSDITIKNASLNPSRIGLVKVLKRMGANIKLNASRKAGSRKLKNGITGIRSTLCAKHEPMGDIIVESSVLKGTKVSKEEIPSLIDELPILMVAACFAKGRTILEGVQELRVKETDRIRSMCANLKKMGAKIGIKTAGSSERLVIEGVDELRGAKVRSFADHRTAMSMVVAGLKAKGATAIDDVSCISKSFPNFTKILNSIII